MGDVALRPVQDSDLDALFEQWRDPAAIHLAAFTARDPADRAAFDAHMAKIRTAPGITLRAITHDGHLAGTISAFPLEGDTTITYWIARSFWNQGITTRALTLLLALVPTRPLHASAASDNLASLRVLQKAGFTVVGTERAYAPARDAEIEETLLRLG